MPVSKFIAALEAHGVDPAVIARVREGYEKVSDRSVKRSAFLAHASAVLDETLDFRTRCDVRADCSCSSGGVTLGTGIFSAAPAGCSCGCRDFTAEIISLAHAGVSSFPGSSLPGSSWPCSSFVLANNWELIRNLLNCILISLLTFLIIIN
jgi:hypothetical protein